MNIATSSLNQLKSTLSDLPEPQRAELARYLLSSLEGKSEHSAWASFADGVGSVLEIAPPPDRLDSWRLNETIFVDEWPQMMRQNLAEIQN